MQTRSSDEISVCPSVKCVHCDKTEEKPLQIFIPCERSFSLVFWEEEWWVGATPSIWNFGSTGPRWSEIANFEPIIARSASAVRPIEKSSINTNKKSPTRFPMSLRWSSYVAPKSPKGGLKKANGRFSSKIALRLKKVWYKVSLCEKCQRQSCRAFSIHSSINTNRKSTTCFPMSPRWTWYVVSKPPKGGSKTQNVQNLNNKLR